MKTAITLAALVAASGAAHAGNVTSYFGEDINVGGSGIVGSLANTRDAQGDFLGRLVGNSVESFESFATGSLATPVGLNFNGSAGSLTADLNGAGLEVRSGPDGAGRFATDGDQYLVTRVAGTQTFSIDFGQDTAAFGFTATDLGDFEATVQLTLSNGDVVVIPNTIGSGGSNSGSAFFFGIVAENEASTFTSVTFDFAGGTGSGGADVFGFDEMTIGDLRQVVPGVPVPSAAGLGLVGLGLAGARRRRA